MEMTVEFATEPIAKPTLLETWGQNERMRHIPNISWMIEKLDGDIRRRLEKLVAPFNRLDPSDGRREPLDHALRALCRAIDRLADAARHQRAGNAPSDLGTRINWGVSQAVTALSSIDASLFGRRYPFQTHERSKAEPVYGAFLTVLDHVGRVTPLVRSIDANIDEALLDGLVVLQEPLRSQPIA
jgi:hypothetical protein